MQLGLELLQKKFFDCFLSYVKLMVHLAILMMDFFKEHNAEQLQ